MKRFNMKTLSLISSLSSLALLMACGDNVTDNDPVTTQAYASQDEFPECEESGEGYFALVSSTNDLYICTASEWVNISKASAGGSAKPGCSSEELENGKGVKIICNGDSVAVLNYGTQGEEGDKGGDGHKGETGDKGEPGSSTNGKDAVWDTDRCKLKNTGSDVMVFDCGDSVYVSSLDISGGNTNNVWNPIPDYSVKYGAQNILTVYNNQFESNATGSLERFDGDDSWDNNSTLVVKDLIRDSFRIKGIAKVEVTKAQTVTANKYRPFVGVKVGFSSINVKSRLGLCLAYTSEKDMALLVEGKTGFLKASIPAAKKTKVVNVAWDEFEPVAKEVNADTVIMYAKGFYVEAVGGEEAGSYENEFSVLMLGDLGNCDINKTYDVWKADLKSKVSEISTFTDGRDSKTYKQITIGDQTWMAENLRYGTNSCYFTNDDANCTKSGRVYTWIEALGTAASTYGCSLSAKCTTTLPSQVQGLCPSGWHLPTMLEWKNLFATVRGDYSNDNHRFPDLALIKYLPGLVNGSQESMVPELNGSDLIGFGLVVKGAGTYWSSIETAATTAKVLDIDYGSYPYFYAYTYTTNSELGYNENKSDKLPVRCVKN